MTVQVDSLAASAASVIAMAGDELVMFPHSELMLHDAWGGVIGDPAEVAKFLDILNRQSEKIAAVYKDKAGGRQDYWRKKMIAETWYSADEAVEAKLADRVAKMPPRKTGDDEQDATAAAVHWSA